MPNSEKRPTFQRILILSPNDENRAKIKIKIASVIKGFELKEFVFYKNALNEISESDILIIDAQEPNPAKLYSLIRIKNKEVPIMVPETKFNLNVNDPNLYQIELNNLTGAIQKIIRR